MSQKLSIVIDTLFLIASNIQIFSSTMINLAYCQNIQENSTAVHRNMINQMTNQLSITSNVISLRIVIINVYGPNENANAFSSNIKKKSLLHFHMALEILPFFWFKKCMIADIHIGYKNTYHMEKIMIMVIVSHTMWFVRTSFIKYWNIVNTDRPLPALYISILFIL